ncbi:hypothetical protein HY947_01725 [Candidatus Gottesmanbacteria bacterium]|nr:hypothetical protein [Candidatus Gottesmanbacteria bacterium]
MKRLLTHPIVVAHILLFIHLAIFLIVTINPYRISPPDRSPVMLRGHLVYTSIIRQAKEGAWSVQIPHTTRESPHVYAHLFFVFLGKVAALFNIDPPIIYMMARVGAAVLLTWATLFFALTVLPKAAQTLAILFVLGLETGPNLLILGKGLWNIQPSIFSYYSQVISYRHFGLPHHTTGEAIGILFLTFFYMTYQKPTIRRIVAVSLTALLGITILPPYMLVLFMTVLPLWGIHAVLNHKIKEYLIGLLASIPVVAGMSLFLKSEFAKGIPWKDFNQVEKTWVTNTDAFVNYISSLLLFYPGILLLFSSFIFQLKSIAKNLSLVIILMSGMILDPLILLPFTHYFWFPLANFRIMDGYTYFPAGILAAIGFSSFLTLFKNTKIKFILSFILISLVLLLSTVLTIVYTRQTLEEQKSIWTNVYPLKNEWKAISFLNTLPKGSGIMVMNYFGEIIPEYAHVRSFIGSTPAYPDWDERHALGVSFYTGKLSDTKARKLLKNNNIDYVFQGSDEKSYLQTTTFYPNLLAPIFSSPGAVVYSIK